MVTKAILGQKVSEQGMLVWKQKAGADHVHLSLLTAMLLKQPELQLLGRLIDKGGLADSSSIFK